jgi:hypothetical protein
VVKKISIIIENVCKFVDDYNEKASDRCKLYTAIALVLALFFAGVDVYEYFLNDKAEQEVHEIADSVYDPIIIQIDNMDEQSKAMFVPLKDLIVEIKPEWIKLSVFVLSIVIAEFIGYIKKPAEGIMEAINNEIDEFFEEPMMWIPFGVFALIDISEVVLSFV